MMKKFAIGLIVGMLVMFSSQAFGLGVSYLGKTVSGEIDVKVNGKVVGQAVVIDGKSFVPVRDISNEIGATIAIDKGVSINLSVTETDGVKESDAADLVKRKIEVYKKEISLLEQQAAEAKIKADNDKSEMGRYRTEYAALKSSLDKQNEKLSALEETLKELE